MFKNYIKIFFRQLYKNKAYSIINIGGLAIGIAAVLFIATYVNFENSYDANLKDSERLYRINLTTYADGQKVEESARTSPAIGGIAKDDIPSVASMSRVVILGESILGYDNNFIRELQIFLTDPNYFDQFDLNLVQGKVKEMEKPLTLMISSTIAEKLFGDQNPVGETLGINSSNFDGSVDFKVVGVFESLAENRHLKPEVLVSYATLHHFIGSQIDQSYDWLNLYTYLKLNDKASQNAVADQLNESLSKNHGEQLKASGKDWQLALQPVQKIHTTTDYTGEYEAGIDGSKLKYFNWVAIFVLIMIYINSINISNTRAHNRVKEIGVRKVTGGSKKQLFVQFIFESFLINLLAMALAVVILIFVSPIIIEWFDLNIPQQFVSPINYFEILIALWVFGGFASGVYPALLLTSFAPAKILKGNFNFKLKQSLAKPLLVFQLICCLVIISGIITTYLQLGFMRNQDLGLALEDKLVVRSPMLFVDGSGNYQEQMRNAMTNLKGVKSVAAANEIPGNEIYWRSDEVFIKGKEKSGNVFTFLHVGDHYFDVFNINLLAGREFNTDLADGQEAIINEKALSILGFSEASDALGKEIQVNMGAVPIVGVVEDYRQLGVNNNVDPAVLNYSPGDLNYYIIDVEQGEMATLLPQIESTYSQLFANSPFEYYFLDEHFDKQYKSEKQFAQLFSLAAIIAVIIAIMGIVGVTTQLMLQRNKEVSIRKIMGASFKDIILIISKEYVWWFTICFAIGIPTAYLLFSNWLNSFLVSIELGWWFFLFPGLMVMFIFIASTLYQSLRTALVNPAETLKNE